MLPSLIGRSAVLEPRPITNSSLFTGNFCPLKITDNGGIPPRGARAGAAPPAGRGGGMLAGPAPPRALKPPVGMPPTCAPAAGVPIKGVGRTGGAPRELTSLLAPTL